MRKDVQVSVLGILDAGGGPEAVLTRTTGICSPQGGGYQVSYRELDEHGNVTDNLLFLSQTEIRIDRSGLEARLEYRLYEGGHLFSQNTLSVHIREDGGDGPAPDHTTRRNHI